MVTGCRPVTVKVVSLGGKTSTYRKLTDWSQQYLSTKTVSQVQFFETPKKKPTLVHLTSFLGSFTWCGISVANHHWSRVSIQEWQSHGQHWLGETMKGDLGDLRVKEKAEKWKKKKNKERRKKKQACAQFLWESWTPSLNRGLFEKALGAKKLRCVPLYIVEWFHSQAWRATVD